MPDESIEEKKVSKDQIPIKKPSSNDNYVD